MRHSYLEAFSPTDNSMSKELKRALAEVSDGEPPCDFCGDAFSSAIPVATDFEGDNGGMLAVVVSCCSYCEDHEALVDLAAEKALVRMGVIEIEYPKEDLN